VYIYVEEMIIYKFNIDPWKILYILQKQRDKEIHIESFENRPRKGRRLGNINKRMN
jgi:hypothetical protein